MSYGSFYGSFRNAAVVGCAAGLLLAAPVAAVAESRGPDLKVLRPAPVFVESGGRSAVHAHVLNDGGATTTDPFTLSVHLPPGVFVAQPFSPSSCRALPFGHTVTCTFPAGLAPGDVADADIPIVTSSGMPAGRLTGDVEVNLPGDLTPQDDTAKFDIVIR